MLCASRLLHPLPFLALVFLLLSAAYVPLNWPQGTVIVVYLLYLLPYVAISYYERYAVPLVGVKVLLVLWGMDRIVFVIRVMVRQPGRMLHATCQAARVP